MVSPGAPGFDTLSDLEAAALLQLTPPLAAYVQGGAGEERTLRANRAALLRYTLRPRLFADVTKLDASATLLGRRCAAPFFLAPTAYQGEIHPDGELATARAAASAGILAAFSTMSTRSLEEIARAGGAGPRWFQLYLQPEFEGSLRLVERAERAGYDALVLTADVPVFPYRDRQMHSGFAIDPDRVLGNGPGVTPPSRALLRPDPSFARRHDARAGWEVVDQLRASTRLPVVVKGVLTAEDARRAVDHGARAVIVSNHGGRQLDGAPASLDALPEVAAAIGDRAEVYVDGGFRRGADLLIALALGARAVGLGRPALWALAAGGEAGVARWIELLRTDLASALALSGRRTLAEIGRDLVRPADGPGPDHPRD